MMLTTEQLADRWSMSPQTLENWRSQGRGPKHIKLGAGKSCNVVYRLRDVEKWEKSHEGGGNHE